MAQHPVNYRTSIAQSIGYYQTLPVWESPPTLRSWLVVSTPLNNMKVSWDYSQYMEKKKKMFQTTNQDGIFGFSPAKRNVVFATHPAFSKHRGVCFLRRKTWRNNGETLFWYYVDIMLINILPNIIST